MARSHDDGGALGALEQYMRQVKQIPPLTSEEEVVLLLSIECSTCISQARERLIEGYQPLIIGLAKRFVRDCRQMELLDLIQEGNLGLLQALQHFDSSKEEASFRTFAFAWIRGVMLTAFWQHEGRIRLPLSKVRAIRRMSVVNTRLLSLLSREPTVAETAREMGMAERDVRELIVLQEQQVVSLHMPLEEDDGLALEDVIIDPAASAFAEDGFSSIDDVLERLTERERVVIKLRYGFDGGQAYTQREIADLLGVDVATVQLVDRRAKKRLHRALCA